MPLRTQQQFYEPFYKQKSGEGIRVFPEKHHDSKEAVLVPIGDLPSVCKSISTQIPISQASMKQSTCRDESPTNMSITRWLKAARGISFGLP